MSWIEEHPMPYLRGAGRIHEAPTVRDAGGPTRVTTEDDDPAPGEVRPFLGFAPRPPADVDPLLWDGDQA